MPLIADFARSYFTDFGEYAPGSAHDWPQAFGDFATEVVAEPGSLSGQALAMTGFAATGTRRWARVPESAAQEVLAIVRLPQTPLPNHTSYARIALRLGADGARYYLLSWDKGKGRLKIERGGLPESDALLAAAPKKPFAPGAVLALRFRAEGAHLRGRIWPFEQAEPADWEIEASDGSIAAGGVGYRKSHQDGTDRLWWFSAGLGGLAAPLPHGGRVRWG